MLYFTSSQQPCPHLIAFKREAISSGDEVPVQTPTFQRARTDVHGVQEWMRL